MQDKNKNMGRYRYFFPKQGRKTLYVSSNTHEAVAYYAKKKGITIQEAAQEIITAGITKLLHFDEE